MDQIKKSLQRCIRDGLDWKDAKIQNVEQIKGGYLSNAYLVTVERGGKVTTVFVKEQNENKWGSERVSDAYATYMASDCANKEHLLSPKVFGSFLSLPDQIVALQKAALGKLYQVQECVSGKNLLGLCDPVVSVSIRENGIQLGEKVAEILANIHSHKHPIERGEKFDEYSRSLRDVLAHPELTLNIFYNFLEGSSVLKGDFRYEYLSEMFRVAEYFSQFKERNSLIHGDVWHANFLVEKLNMSLIDYSRMVHGEPGIDVGHFYAACLWLALMQKNDFHIFMARAFLSKYIAITKDDFIRESMVTYIGFTGAVSVVEDFYPTVDSKDREKFIAYIFKCLQNKRIKEISTWKEIL